MALDTDHIVTKSEGGLNVKFDGAIPSPEKPEVKVEEVIPEIAAESVAEGVADGGEEHEEATEHGEGEDRPKKKGGFQKRIDKLNVRLDTVTQEVEYWKQQALSKGAAAPAPEATKPAVSNLDIDSFPDLPSYLSALADERAEAKLAERDAAVKAAEEAKKVAESQQSWARQMEEARSRYSDLDDILDQDLPVTPLMSEIILGSKVGVDLAVWLGQNPEEAKRIASLPTYRASHELLQVEDRLLAKPGKVAPKVTKAPTPITPLSGTKAPSVVPSASEDYDAWSVAKFGKSL